MKRVVVFGANGKVGKLVVDELLARGYVVTACVYGASSFPNNDKLNVVTADVHNAAQVAEAIKGNDAVISTLGSWHTPTMDILSSAMTNIIPVMQANKIKRVVSLTGADARDQDDRVPLINRLLRPVFQIIAPKILQDGEEHIRLLRQSSLDWTVLRSPVMNEAGRRGSYRLSKHLPTPFATIHRQDVAHAMVDLLEDTKWYQASPVIYR